MLNKEIKDNELNQVAGGMGPEWKEEGVTWSFIIHANRGEGNNIELVVNGFEDRNKCLQDMERTINTINTNGGTVIDSKCFKE